MAAFLKLSGPGAVPVGRWSTEAWLRCDAAVVAEAVVEGRWGGASGANML